jgi:hypothetical protein
MLARKRKSIRTNTGTSKNFSVGVELVQGAFEGRECSFCDVCATSKVTCIKKGTESFNDFIIYIPTYSGKIDL